MFRRPKTYTVRFTEAELREVRNALRGPEEEWRCSSDDPRLTAYQKVLRTGSYETKP